MDNLLIKLTHFFILRLVDLGKTENIIDLKMPSINKIKSSMSDSNVSRWLVDVKIKKITFIPKEHRHYRFYILFHWFQIQIFRFVEKILVLKFFNSFNKIFGSCGTHDQLVVFWHTTHFVTNLFCAFDSQPFCLQIKKLGANWRPTFYVSCAFNHLGSQLAKISWEPIFRFGNTLFLFVS